jgi:transposase
VSAYIYAAVEPGTDNAFALILPDANSAGMQVFLDAFAETIADDEHVALVLDGAGWHGSKALRVPSNITLVPLPPYSPELNPVERVWLYLSASCRCACTTTIRRSSLPRRKHGDDCAERLDASRRSRHTLGS